MLRLRLSLTAGAALALFVPLCEAKAQETGNADQGMAYAQQVCARCHAIRMGDEQSPHPNAPSFDAIANTPGASWVSLATILRSTHENMPNFVLAPDEQENVIAYILSLKR